MEFEELWANKDGQLVPLHELTDEEVLKFAAWLGSEVEEKPRFKLELIRRGLYGTNQKP